MNFKLLEIIFKAHSSLYTDDAGLKSRWSIIKKIIIFDIMPGAVALFFLLKGNTIGSQGNFIDYLLLTCSIFAGLLFSLMVVIVDKAKKIKEVKDSKKENEFYYLRKYLRFSRHLITKISFSIFLALVIIIIVSCNNLTFGIKVSILNQLKPEIFTFFLFYFAIQFGLLILDIISDMYEVFKDEIGN